ncbi:helix-turn-helix transcriptional regulator [Microbacterium sp. A204]|uniref:helix-turn-helix transcriptional regulator n=1 Tax=Microbacterium sp. A204 TaxID=3457321 RepID=UPI003FD61485
MTLIDDSKQANALVLLRLGRKIKIARIAADMKQDDLGQKVGVSRSAVGLWEKGETEPSASKLFAIARVTGQRIEWFAEGVNAETAPAEAGAVSVLSQHSVRHKGLEPLTF